ncbi:MipA/OmpV family protein [Sphingomonas sp. MMS24-JH45]
MRVIHLLALALGAALPLSGAAAQTNPLPAEPNPTPDPGLVGDTVTVGIAAAWLPDYEGSDDYRLVPGPAAIGSVRNLSFQVLGNRASIDLIPNAAGPTWDFQAGPIGVVNFNRSSRNQIDDPRVKALPERGTAIELAAMSAWARPALRRPYDKLSASLSYRYDVAGVHSSGIWQPR